MSTGLELNIAQHCSINNFDYALIEGQSHRFLLGLVATCIGITYVDFITQYRNNLSSAHIKIFDFDKNKNKSVNSLVIQLQCSLLRELITGIQLHYFSPILSYSH